MCTNVWGDSSFLRFAFRKREKLRSIDFLSSSTCLLFLPFSFFPLNSFSFTHSFTPFLPFSSSFSTLLPFVPFYLSLSLFHFQSLLLSHNIQIDIQGQEGSMWFKESEPGEREKSMTGTDRSHELCLVFLLLGSLPENCLRLVSPPPPPTPTPSTTTILQETLSLSLSLSLKGEWTDCFTLMHFDLFLSSLPLFLLTFMEVQKKE